MFGSISGMGSEARSGARSDAGSNAGLFFCSDVGNLCDVGFVVCLGSVGSIGGVCVAGWIGVWPTGLHRSISFYLLLEKFCSSFLHSVLLVCPVCECCCRDECNAMSHLR